MAWRLPSVPRTPPIFMDSSSRSKRSSIPGAASPALDTWKDSCKALVSYWLLMRVGPWSRGAASACGRAIRPPAWPKAGSARLTRRFTASPASSRCRARRRRRMASRGPSMPLWPPMRMLTSSSSRLSGDSMAEGLSAQCSMASPGRGDSSSSSSRWRSRRRARMAWRRPTVLAMRPISMAMSSSSRRSAEDEAPARSTQWFMAELPQASPMALVSKALPTTSPARCCAMCLATARRALACRAVRAAPPPSISGSLNCITQRGSPPHVAPKAPRAARAQTRRVRVTAMTPMRGTPAGDRKCSRRVCEGAEVSAGRG
mmetsp:Transcript_39221/g.124684  ORF Transcript_39221/g.124684 Transcript_39221/m.124684 type:complete len:316 (+) Transcript_39221:154-1101(+)